MTYMCFEIHVILLLVKLICLNSYIFDEVLYLFHLTLCFLFSLKVSVVNQEYRQIRPMMEIMKRLRIRKTDQVERDYLPQMTAPRA